ncbi:MAG: aldo/keto reductase [Candidatus Latescibacterota bacterium]
MTYDTRFYGLEFAYTHYNGMPYLRLGSSGLKVSRVGLGTWKMGYPERRDGSRVGRDTALGILDRALALGVTFWDTANRYNESSGNSERVLGEWFRAHRGERRNVVLATKVGGCMDGVTPNHGGLSRGSVLDSVYASLDRLGLEYIDLLQFHRVDPEVSIEESLEAVADLRQRDLVRYFGLSNATVGDLQEYRRVARDFRLPMVCSVQNGFNPLTGSRATHQDILPYCAEHGISFIAYSPLLRGLLTNRYLKGSKVGAGDRLVDEGSLEQLTGEEVYAKLDRLAELAGGLGLTVSQVSLAYMLALPGMGPLIPSASTVQQLEENAAAGTVELSPETLEELRRIFVS